MNMAQRPSLARHKSKPSSNSLQGDFRQSRTAVTRTSMPPIGPDPGGGGAGKPRKVVPVSDRASRRRTRALADVPYVAPLSPSSRPQPPVSFDHEQRQVIVVTSQAARDVRTFRASYRVEGAELTRLPATATLLLTSLPPDYDPDEIETCRDFRRVFKAAQIEISGKKKTDYEALNTFCEKGIHFQELAVSVRQRLTDCYSNHAARYLVSFADQCPGLEVACVDDYQNHINEKSGAICRLFKQVNAKLEEFWQLKHPFLEGFLASAAKANRTMDDVCIQLLDICEVLRKWVHEDRSYPAKLWDEVVLGNLQRNRIIDEVKRCKRKKEGFMQQLRKREEARDRVAEQLTGHQRLGEDAVEGHGGLRQQLTKLEQDIHNRQRELSDAQRRVEVRQSNSPRYLELMWKKIEEIKTNLEGMTSKAENLKQRVTQLQRTATETGDLTKHLTKQLNSNNDSVQSMRIRVTEVDAQLEAVQQELELREARIYAAKKIRDMKSSAVALRKLYQQVVEASSSRGSTATTGE